VANAPLRSSGQQSRARPSGPAIRTAAPLPTKRRGKWERRARSPKVPWIAGAILILGLAGALAWQRYETSRPTYALAQIALAARLHDSKKLAYYVDAGALTGQIVTETVQWLTAHRRFNDIEAGEAERGSQGRDARIQTATVTLENRASNAVSAALQESANATDLLPQNVVDAYVAAPPMLALFGGDRLDLRAVGNANVFGQNAEIPLTLRDRELVVDIHLTLELERDGSRWRLVGLEGLGPAFRVIDNAQLERVDIANRLRREHMDGLLAIGAPTVGRVYHRRSRNEYVLQIPLTNRSTQPITEVAMDLRAHGMNEERALPLRVQHLIPAGGRSPEAWRFTDPSAGTRSPYLLMHPERLLVGLSSMVVDSAGRPDTLRQLRSYREFRAAPNGGR
jgi:hypothetical protein